MSIYKAGRPWKFDPTTGAGHRPPNSPGEYRMRDGSGCITYIGETNDLARRMREHIRSGKLPTGQGCGSTLEYMVADGRSTSRTRRGARAAVHREAPPHPEPLQRRGRQTRREVTLPWQPPGT